MTRKGDVVTVSCGALGEKFDHAPRVCVFGKSRAILFGVIVAEKDEALAGEGHIMVPSEHTMSKRVLALFMDLKVVIHPDLIVGERIDFVCGPSLEAALMLGRGLVPEVLEEELYTDEHDETDVEGGPFDVNESFHSMKRCRVSDGDMTVTFFMGRGRPCFVDEYGDDLREHQQRIAKAMRENNLNALVEVFANAGLEEEW